MYILVISVSSSGTSVNIKDYSGRTPLHMAAFRGLSDIMFLLLENRGDVNARDNQVHSMMLFTWFWSVWYGTYFSLFFLHHGVRQCSFITSED